MDISVQYLRPVQVLSARCGGAYASSAPTAWQTIRSWLEAQCLDRRTHVKQAVGCVYGALSCAATVAAPAVRAYDACIELHPAAVHVPKIGLTLQTLDGGTFAVYRLQGPHAQISRTLALMQTDWLPASGFVADPARPVLEIFQNDPAEVPKAELLTNICLPVRLGRVA